MVYISLLTWTHGGSMFIRSVSVILYYLYFINKVTFTQKTVYDTKGQGEISKYSI